jgi:hypothetical protein
VILEALFCQVDDFCISFMPQWEKTLIEADVCRKTWQCTMSPSEIMTIVLLFHQSSYRNFKRFYIDHVMCYMRSEFPNLLSYNRFVEQQQRVLFPLVCFMHSLPKQETGIYYVDSTTIKACHIKREKQHKVFAGLADKSCSTLGWFFGFKLHLLINSVGEIMRFKLTKATVDDRGPVPELAKDVFGKLFGDKGYISKKLTTKLFTKGLRLITKQKKNMQPQILDPFDEALLKKRGIIESVIDQLKNISQIEHTRHRSLPNFLLNLIAGLTAYSLKPKKPSINMECSGVAI